jgi:two-component system cell cycle response regulator
MRVLPANRTLAWSLLAINAAFVVCALEYTFTISEGVRAALNSGGYDAIVLAAAALCLARGIARKRDRSAWILMGLAVGAWGIGDTIWTFTVVNDPNAPYPSLADAFYLAVYPPAYVAIFLLLRSRVGNLRGSLWLDGIMGGLAVAALGTAVVFQAVLHATGGSPAAVATNLAYPLADLTLIALVVWALAMTGWRPGRTWGFIAAGLLVFSVSDCLYLYQTAVGSYVHGSVTDLGWLGGAVLLAWAAWQPDEKPARVATDGLLLMLAPIAFGLIGLGILVYDHVDRVSALPLALACAAMVAVIARMAYSFAENMTMISSSRLEARTDVLTGIGNRRKLYDDLARLVAEGDGESELVLFDLNGFKHYNDSFGHPAGDALLARLGQELSSFVTGRGHAYRMGGDEFCIVIPATEERAMVIAGAARALSDRGEGFCITAACGSVLVPAEATTVADAVRLADQRMYTDKQSSRASAGDQSSGVLLRALAECHPPLGDHVAGVAHLAELVARKLGLAQDEVARARLTGALHDIGKMAIPDDILEKPGPLAAEEWEFLHRHTLIGERILVGAPALAHVAGLVRSSHERFDGTGYPDALAGTDIPLVSRIVFVCDAFDAMISKRPYGEARTIEAALAELKRTAGTQFDPVAVAAFADVLADRGAPRIALAS